MPLLDASAVVSPPLSLLWLCTSGPSRTFRPCADYRKVVADFLSSVGVDRVLTVDLHAEQIEGFFDVPVDNCFGSPILLRRYAATESG